MSIDPQYQGIYNQAKNMQFQMHDVLGHENPSAQVLHSQMKGLMTDIELNKHPRDVENRIKMIQNQMHSVEHQGQPFMSYGHASAMHDNFEHMRRQVRGFGNYN